MQCAILQIKLKNSGTCLVYAQLEHGTIAVLCAQITMHIQSLSATDKLVNCFHIWYTDIGDVSPLLARRCVGAHCMYCVRLRSVYVIIASWWHFIHFSILHLPNNFLLIIMHVWDTRELSAICWWRRRRRRRRWHVLVAFFIADTCECKIYVLKIK